MYLPQACQTLPDSLFAHSTLSHAPQGKFLFILQNPGQMAPPLGSPPSLSQKKLTEL